MKKRIIVVDDEPLIAILMKEIIEEEQEFEIAQIVSEKDEFLNFVNHYSFDVAIIDISIGGREGGIELLKTMKAGAVSTPVIMLSAHDEILYAPKCLQTGAKGYINKRYICTDIIQCLRQVLAGNLFVSGDKGEFILNQHRKTVTLPV